MRCDIRHVKPEARRLWDRGHGGRMKKLSCYRSDLSAVGNCHCPVPPAQPLYTLYAWFLVLHCFSYLNHKSSHACTPRQNDNELILPQFSPAIIDLKNGTISIPFKYNGLS
eukprot:756183-Hanusia_phi.AAC.1